MNRLNRRAGWLALVAVLGISAASLSAADSSTSASASAPATQSDSPVSPKAALKAYNAAMRTGDTDAMIALEHATTDDEQRVAHACAQSDREVGRLIAAARDRFGDDAAKRVSSAINDKGDEDIDAGTQSIDGSHGGVVFAGESEPSPLVQINGKWLLDVNATIKASGNTADALANFVIQRGSIAKVTAQELTAGQYATIDAVVDVLKSRLKDQ